MSITGALSNALTGLAAASRSAQVVSSNVSNALTEGYARREVNLSARQGGGAGAGVQVDGISRVIDEVILREKRLAAASNGGAQVAVNFEQAAFDLIGSPESPGSLNAQVANFETALLEAASRPDEDARLSSVLDAAHSLAGKLNSASDGVQKLRQDADSQINAEVGRLNSSLKQIAELNEQIQRAKVNDRDFPSLLDQRQQIIDEISELVPIRQLDRGNDSVALYTMGGALLLDVEPAEFGFTTTSPITADMTQASGALSGLTINGEPVQTSGNFSAIGGGILASLFDLRDSRSVELQGNLDEIARDLVSRFEDPALDPTLTAGDPGLFTDQGAALDPTDLIGLASRVEVNALVDPVRGGELWRLRDGLGAAAPGAVGDATLLNAKIDVLSETRAPVGGSFSAGEKSVAGFAASLTSLTGQSLLTTTSRLSYETARYEGLEETLLLDGVDTDQEMQKLLLIEQAYAANARVIQTVDELIQILIGL
ncbi:MAG: flagellar hook-associated protein FlgK [Silicimonas sp.]|nr:flagellar hook-associated protein FlgK [Silicimonas sp.]